jgi:hypothetical protein
MAHLRLIDLNGHGGKPFDMDCAGSLALIFTTISTSTAT